MKKWTLVHISAHYGKCTLFVSASTFTVTHFVHFVGHFRVDMAKLSVSDKSSCTIMDPECPTGMPMCTSSRPTLHHPMFSLQPEIGSKIDVIIVVHSPRFTDSLVFVITPFCTPSKSVCTTPS